MKRLLFSLLLIPLLLSCKQSELIGVVAYEFESTVCVSNIQPIPFLNSTKKNMEIEGVAIAAGTDPDANFVLEDVLISSSSEVAANISVLDGGGSFSDIAVPKGGSYAFQVNYTPKTSGAHNAVIDIVYRAPESAVQQIHLSGSATGEGPVGCVVVNEGGEVEVDGEMLLTITKIVAATSKISQPLHSEDGVRPLEVIPISLNLNAEAGTAELVKINEGDVILPLPKDNVEILGGNVFQDTVLSTSGPVSGTFDPATGSLSLEDMEVTLDGDFNTTITTSLTTDQVSLSDLSTPLIAAAIEQFGRRHYDSIGDRIFGSRIDEDGNFVVVGITVIGESTLDPGANAMFDDLSGTSMAILLEGNIQPAVAADESETEEDDAAENTD